MFNFPSEDFFEVEPAIRDAVPRAGF